jgi:hypothetical protein
MPVVFQVIFTETVSLMLPCYFLRFDLMNNNTSARGMKIETMEPINHSIQQQCCSEGRSFLEASFRLVRPIAIAIAADVLFLNVATIVIFADVVVHFVVLLFLFLLFRIRSIMASPMAWPINQYDSQLLFQW